MKQTCPRTRIMGILNVTPDSFSDGGSFFTTEAILAQTEKMVGAGADIIDIGGESTRPFADPVSIEEESRRVITAITAIRQHFSTPLSIDTTKEVVARRALDAGADIINDISALRFDSGMLHLVRETEVPVILMHMQGTPKNMQVEPVYQDVVAEIMEFFRERLSWVEEQGIDRSRFIVDPGIGFGKTVGHNLTILNRLEEFLGLGCPVLVGHSRKSFIGKILNREVDERDTATAAISSLCVMKGAAILRVHDVEKTLQAVRIAEAILNEGQLPTDQ